MAVICTVKLKPIRVQTLAKIFGQALAANKILLPIRRTTDVKQAILDMI